MTHTSLSIEALDLCNTISRMDSLSQGGFAAVAAVAKRALARLDTPDGRSHPERMADALRAIWGTAEQFGNDINCEAEGVGCNHVGGGR